MAINYSEWIDVPDTNGKYQVNFDGEVRRLYKDGTYRQQPTYRSKKNKYYFKINKREVSVQKIVWESFHGKIPKGMCIIHKNGMLSDNCINNLQLVTLKESNSLSGRILQTRPVVKMDRKGNIVEFYPSISECARRNSITKTTIARRCNGQCKYALAVDGFAYAWEDDRNIIKKKIKQKGNIS